MTQNKLAKLGFISLLVIFSSFSLYLQTKKAPWVDECYTYYGVMHDSFSEFKSSICSGINFSPPLYFFFNWLIQLSYPLSIETLRVESLFWLLVGCFLCFATCRKAFGEVPAYLSFFILLSQSEILAEQALEARHYTMFFACGAWVLFQTLKRESNQNSRHINWLLFLAHLCLCMTHYMGIIFSVFAGITHIFFHLEKPLWKRIPYVLTFCWSITVPIYAFLLNMQSSHLGNWPRPNDLSALIEVYNRTFIFLTIVLALLFFPLVLKLSRSQPLKTQVEPQNNIVLCTAFCWLSIPLGIWLLSHISPLNLFKERYFIPMEAGFFVVLSFAFQCILSKAKLSLPTHSFTFPLTAFFLFCLGFFVLSSKRALFALHPSHNYHHSLIAPDHLFAENELVIFPSDPSFFPNSIRHNKQSLLKMPNDELRKIYRSFSSKIKFSIEQKKDNLPILVFDPNDQN